MYENDDPCYLRSLTALLLFIMAMPLIVAGMISIAITDWNKRRKNLTKDTERNT